MPIRKANTLQVADIIDLDGYPVQIARILPMGGFFSIEWIEVDGDRRGMTTRSYNQGVEKILQEDDGESEPEKPEYVDIGRPSWLPPIPSIQIDA